MSPCQVLGININDLHSNNLQWLKKTIVYIYKESNNFCKLVKKIQTITRITNLVFHSNKNEEEQKTKNEEEKKSWLYESLIKK